MRAIFSNKMWIAFLSLIAIVALTVLATGLGNINFQEGRHFGQEESNAVRSASLSAAQSMFSLPFQSQIAFWILIVLLIALIGLMLSPELRKRAIKEAIRVAVIYYALYLLFTRYQEILAQNNTPNEAQGSATTSAAIPEFAPPESVSWISYLLTFIIIAILLFIAWKVYLFWKEISTPTTEFTKERIAKIARASILDLSSGRESTDVILNCYYRMGDAVSHRKNIDRNASMTPSEFASRLVAAGLPSDAVQMLTQLFESVRYGGRKSDPKMINDAVACLTSILQYCGEPA